MAEQPLGVLLIHGFTSSLDCVRGIEPPLKALGHPTRMPVLRGHGAKSPEALRGVTWHDWVADGEAAMQALMTEAEKVIAFGHSMGGLVALTLAAEHAIAVDSLVLAGAAIQMTSPFAPVRPFHFLTPLFRRFFKKWDMPLVYADQGLAKYDTNYRWAPTDAISTLFNFAEVTHRRLPEIRIPTIILQSRRDTIVTPKCADLIFNAISTPREQKRIIWFEVTEHEICRDCEREATIKAVVDSVRERAGVMQ